VVDVASIMIAYTIGVNQSNFFLGVGYAVFDAIIVVWLRKPISNLIRTAVKPMRRPSIPSDSYSAGLPELDSRQEN
jgi:hypothetical protein